MTPAPALDLTTSLRGDFQALFQAVDASSFPSSALNQMFENFFFGPCDFPARAYNCTLRVTTNTQKGSQVLSRYKSISC